ncbi:MAG: homocysteine S-methyltransferase family protein [Phycisphaerales bacterium]|nr:MAG: homocysteine S-methyltransferase family protein [Phycisphaerales bacterium]
MKQLLERVKQGDVLVGDGAMGTLLFQKGLEAGACPESINLTRPEVLEEIAERYLGAGAEILETNTFGGSPIKLSMSGLAEQAEEINRSAVRAVRKIAGNRAYVSGSCGPTGKLLKPYGDADPEDLRESFRVQIGTLVEAGVDVICIETMTDLAEAKLALAGAREVSATIPIMATMTFDATPRGFFTIMGVSVQAAASGLREAGADIIGSNCGNGIENMIAIAKGFRSCCDAPLIIQSNAGLPKTVGGTLEYDEMPEFMADKSRELIDIGVSVIGGCCGTTPEHTRAIRELVDNTLPR